MADLIRPDYHASMEDLYSLLVTAWGNYGVHQASFATYKALYTPALQTTALAEVEAAQLLPDDDLRKGSSEMLRLGLVEMGKACMQNFQFLKGYIDGAYLDAAARKIQYVMAGQNSYRGASNGDWEAMMHMNTNAKSYLATSANVTALTAGNNMPTGFVATQKTASDNFDAQYSSFKLAEETSVETANKIKANNAIFRTGMAMMSDAQRIFMNDPDIMKKFVFSNLLGMINPAVAGIRGHVKEAVTNMAIAKASIVAQRDGDVAEVVPVDVDGAFGMQLKEGHYMMTVSAEGYVEQKLDMELKLTGLKRLDIVMERMV